VGKVKRGVFFTIDAVFALLALLSIISMFTLLSLESVSSELTHETLHAETGDMIGSIAKLRVIDIWSQEEVRALYSYGYLEDKDLNKTLIEVEGALWSINDSQYLEAARNLTTMVFAHMLQPNIEWQFTVDNETLFNTSTLTGDSRIVTVSRRLVSGYAKSRPHVGFAAKAYLTNIQSKESSRYFFFGGFVGQGNITAVIRDVPSDANISQVYMEMNIGNDFDLYINQNLCGRFNKTGGNFSVENWTITNPACLSYVVRGLTNNLTLNYTPSNITSKYVGGGYIRVVYNTSEFGDYLTGTERYYFPGIEGIVNLYDSFYVPGTLRNLSAYIHIMNNYTTVLNIGNKTAYEQNGSSSIQNIYLNDTNFSILSYFDLSNVTVPLRLRAGANVTGGTLGNADVVLITDVSGSMGWRVGYNDATGVQEWSNNCSNPNMYTSANTQRLALARCLDKQFVEIVLNGSGNRIALVSFSDQVINYTTLSSSASYLNSTIETYNDLTSTCICCSINQAKQILEAGSTPGRLRFIVVMSDGIAGLRCHTVGSCYWWNGEVSPTDRTLYSVSMYNDTRGFAVGAGSTTAGRILRWRSPTWDIINNTANLLYGIHMYNSTLGFAVGTNGQILRWNGAAWVLGATIGASTIRSVFIVNGTLAYAVGDSGRVYSWNGATWVLNTTLAGTLYSVEFNTARTEGFIVGSGGRIYRWTYPTWTAVASGTANDLRDVAFVNRTDYSAYAVGVNAAGLSTIRRWDPTAAAWSADVSPFNNDLYTVLFINSSRGYALGENGAIAKWNGTSWRTDYTPTASTLYGSTYVNSTLSYAVGASGRILNWTIPLWNGTNTVGNECCSGSSGDCTNLGCESAMMNAIWSTSTANASLQNLSVDSVGFGPISACDNANYTLREVAAAGNGTFYASDNATQLQLIYQALGLRILIYATSHQELMIVGGMQTILYPDSYLEFHFDMAIPPLGYRDISVTQETEPFSGCYGNFTIPWWFTPYEVRVTSYSANYWTHNVSVMSSATANQLLNVFNLSVYGLDYEFLGDPFNVRFPAQYIVANETNYINITTGLNPANDSLECSISNKLIYKAKFPASVPFSSILDNVSGSNVTVYFDINGDGVPDGNQTVLLGFGIDGVTFDPAPKTVDELNASINAIDDAFIRLLDYINFNTQMNPDITCTGTEEAGTWCNPIDVQLSDDLLFRVSSVTEVPYLWGPVDMGVVTWVKGD
jgi:hypothetical protein